MKDKLTFAAIVLIVAILSLGLKAVARAVQAEDDCAPRTWSVVRTGPVLWCVGEGLSEGIWRKSELAFKGDRVRRRMH